MSLVLPLLDYRSLRVFLRFGVGESLRGMNSCRSEQQIKEYHQRECSLSQPLFRTDAFSLSSSMTLKHCSYYILTPSSLFCRKIFSPSIFGIVKNKHYFTNKNTNNMMIEIASFVIPHHTEAAISATARASLSPK